MDLTCRLGTMNSMNLQKRIISRLYKALWSYNSNQSMNNWDILSPTKVCLIWQKKYKSTRVDFCKNSFQKASFSPQKKSIPKTLSWQRNRCRIFKAMKIYINTSLFRFLCWNRSFSKTLLTFTSWRGLWVKFWRNLRKISNKR